MDSNQLCARENLQAVVFQSHRFTVDDDGCGVDFVSCGNISPHYPDEYRCANCGNYFEYDSSEVDPWQQALDHVSSQGAA